jgi:arylsulfatase A-like enzyme
VITPLARVPFRPGPATVVRWAIWFGMIAGTLELAAFLLKCLYLDPRNFNVSRQFPWMYPLAGILVVGGPGLVLAVVELVRPGRVRSSGVLFVFQFLTFLGILFRCPIYTAVCVLLAAGLAFQLAPWVAQRAARFDLMVRRSQVVLAGLLLATFAVCNTGGFWAEQRALDHLPQSLRGAPNVLLIVLDTVRAESLSLYGYPRPTTPNLERLATRGVRFNRAFATAPWTAPSHAGMFTGRWPHELSVAWNRPLDATSATLAEFLATRGYATAGFVANTIYCSYETGLDRGFAHYEDYDVSLRAVLSCSALVERTVNFLDRHPAIAAAIGLGGTEPRSSSARKSAARINRDFLTWLDRHEQRGGGRPFFAFLNYFDAHHPYFPPRADGESPGGEGRPFGREPESPADVRLIKNWWEVDKQRLGPGDVALARDAYDRCIASLDRQLGRLFDVLERRGVLCETLVVVTADHGEHFGEQGLFGHGCSVYLPELHVPLLIRPPGGGATAMPGRVVEEPVSLRNLAVTIASALGPSVAAASPFPGRSLLAGPLDEPVLCELAAPPECDPNHGASPVCRGPLVSLVDRGYQYIRNGDGREELYDLGNDRGARHNLAGAAGAGETLRRLRELQGRAVSLRLPFFGSVR